MGVDEAQNGIHGTVSHMPPEALRDSTFGLATDVSHNISFCALLFLSPVFQKVFRP